MTAPWIVNARRQWIEAAELGIQPFEWLTPNTYTIALTYWKTRLARMLIAMMTAFPQTERRVAGFAYRHNLTNAQFAAKFTNWFLGTRRLSAHRVIQSPRGLTILKGAMNEFMAIRDQWDATTYQMPWLDEVVSEDDDF